MAALSGLAMMCGLVVESSFCEMIIFPPLLPMILFALERLWSFTVDG